MTGRDEVHWLDAEQQHVWRSFALGHQLLWERLDRDLRAAHDLSLNEYEILVRLSERPEHRMRMALLADSVCHSRSRLTHTVSRMERAGLLERVVAAEDGRGVVAAITEHGLRTLQEAAPTHVAGVRRNLVDLAESDDFRAFGRVWDKVSDRLLAGLPEIADIR